MRRSENLSVYDATIRAVVGFVLLNMTAMGYLGPIGLIGLILFATAYKQHCPIYHSLGVSTSQDGDNEDGVAQPAE